MYSVCLAIILSYVHFILWINMSNLPWNSTLWFRIILSYSLLPYQKTSFLLVLYSYAVDESKALDLLCTLSACVYDRLVHETAT